MPYGKGKYTEESDNMYLEVPKEEFRVKMCKYSVDYEYYKPAISEVTIDFSKELLGVINNIIRKEQTMIFKDGKIKKQ